MPLHWDHCAACATYLDTAHMNIYSEDNGTSWICNAHRPRGHGSCYDRKSSARNCGTSSDDLTNPIYHACSYCATNNGRTEPHECSTRHPYEKVWQCSPTKNCPDHDV